jgi:hypothetical protein
MRIMPFLFVVLLAGCTKVSEEELKIKIDACSAAGMNYTYLRDYKGQPYDVMCVAKRLR